MNTQTETKKTHVPKRRRMKGVVVSDKMRDTAVVRVVRYAKHPKYGKYLKIPKKYKVHDPENTCKAGDVVEIEETRPVSKEKHFKIVSE